MDVSTFTVRRACSLEDVQWVIEVAVENDWMVREQTGNRYFAAGLTRNFFIGELNGERISCIAVVKHGEASACVGYYIVLELFRGKGYGLKTWEAALESVGSDCNVQLYSVMEMQSKYENLGFSSGWLSRRYTFTVARAEESLSDFQLPSSVGAVFPAGQVSFEKLVEYGADMMGSSQACRLMLAAWISHSQESSWAAISSRGDVLGYLIMTKTARFPHEGYRIGPFYSDSAPVARSLLKVAVEYSSHKNPAYLFLDLPFAINLEGAGIMEEFGARICFSAVFMATRDIPDVPHRKVYGAASEEIICS